MVKLNRGRTGVSVPIVDHLHRKLLLDQRIACPAVGPVLGSLIIVPDTCPMLTRPLKPPDCMIHFVIEGTTGPDVLSPTHTQTSQAAFRDFPVGLDSLGFHSYARERRDEILADTIKQGNEYARTAPGRSQRMRMH
jgi:hypothetical protein